MLALFLFVWLMCLSCVRTNSVLDVHGYSNLVNSVVVIKLPIGLCSGFFIEENRILTSAHCMMDVSSPLQVYEVVTYRQYLRNEGLQDSTPFVMIHEDNIRDLAILEQAYVSSPIRAEIPPIYNGTYPQIGTPTICVGHPAGQLFTVTTGVVSRIGMIDRISEVSYVFSSTPVWYGNSGGPLFDDRGRVIGLTRGIIQDQNYLGRFVSWSEIREYLSETHAQEEQESRD